MPPYLVYEGPRARTRAQVGEALESARHDGWLIVHGWAAPLEGDQIICTGTIASLDHARRALLAAISGAGLIIAARANRDTVDRFIDDLRRLGPVQHVTAERAKPPPPTRGGAGRS
jgi:hypothetical protein